MFTALVEQFGRINTWTRDGTRAPHKPLLILLALGRLSRGLDSVPFNECEETLTDLLREFGPSRKSYHPEYPFWRLQNDGLWEVVSTIQLTPRQSNSDPPKSQLRLGNAAGRFPEPILSELRSNPSRIKELAQMLLLSHFPESLHQDILDEVGLSFDPSSSRGRDSRFRTRILIAYEYKCAVCGLDMRIGNVTVALEAAHIQWHQAGGPDIEPNGVALCALHHKIFDLGGFTIHTDLRILVSERIHGASQFEEVLLRHHGMTIRKPQRTDHFPAPKYLNWHRREVFKDAPRPPRIDD